MKILKLAALALLVAVPLAGQKPDSAKEKHEHGGMGMGRGMMSEMMGPMMGIMAYMPEHLLSKKEDLKLTADQVTKLTALQTQAEAAHESMMSAVKPHFDAMNAAFAKGDSAGAKMHFHEAHEAMGKAHAAGLGLAVQARAALTDAQRDQVDKWAKDMQEDMQEKMKHGPEH